jgi:hypothetical protein
MGLFSAQPWHLVSVRRAVNSQPGLLASFRPRALCRQGLPRFLPGPLRVQPAPMTCRCDMFRDPHPEGYAADGVVCELALPGQRISPHLALALSQMWADAERKAHAAPPLTDEGTRRLRQLLQL